MTSPHAELPLAGLTVVALEQAVAAPFATRQLADLGARVIKVERPGTGDFARHYDQATRGQSSYFIWLNRGKESIELDLKSADGQAVLAALIGRADVLVQNLAPGAAERLGLTAAALARQHPRLIYCSISGYGPDGPYRQKKAYDLLVQCEAGLLSVTGTPDEPAKAGHLGGRHRGRHVRLHRRADRAVRAGADRPRRQLPGRHAGRARRVDEPAVLLQRLR